MAFPNAQQWAAVAAVGSVIAAIASLRLQKKLADMSVMPELVPDYGFGEDYITISNNGKGPAKNIRLETTQWHILNTGQIIKYKVSDDTPKIVRPGEKIKLRLTQSDRITIEGIDLNDPGYDLFTYMNNMAVRKYLSIVFSNSLNERNIIRFKFKEVGPNKYQLQDYELKKYYPVIDWAGANWFRILKYPRQMWGKIHNAS